MSKVADRSRGLQALLVILTLLVTMAAVVPGAAADPVSAALKNPDVTVDFFGLKKDGTQVKSLEPTDGFRCGDTVTFRSYVAVRSRAPAGAHVLRVTHEFGQNPGGANHGVGFRDLAGITVDGTPTTAHATTFPTNLSHNAAITVQLTGMAPGTTRVVEITMRLLCSPPFKLGGNVHSGVGDVIANPDTLASSISIGGQNVPLKTTVQASSITVVKATDVATAQTFPFTWGVAGQANPPSFTLASGGSHQLSPLYPGDFVIEEIVPAGWSLDAITCTGHTASTVTPDLAGNKVTVGLQAGEHLTCTFTNVEATPPPPATATLTIAKDSGIEDATFDFTSDIPGHTSFDITTVNGTGSHGPLTVAPGTYEIAEVVPSGWTLTDATCDNGDTPDAVSLAAGDDVTCTFTNSKDPVPPSTATLTIVKTTVGNDATFDFTSDIPGHTSFDITTVNGTGSHGPLTVAPGTYDISEVVPSGWTLTDATCDNGDTPDAVTLAAGDDVTCTFANEVVTAVPSANITIVKNTVGGNGSFAFTSDLPGAAAFSITTVGGSGSHGPLTVPPGTYSIAEVVPAGWSLTGAACSNGDLPGVLTVTDGLTVVCTFTNQAQGGGGLPTPDPDRTPDPDPDPDPAPQPEPEAEVEDEVLTPGPETEVEDDVPAPQQPQTEVKTEVRDRTEVRPSPQPLPRTGADLVSLLALAVGLGLLGGGLTRAGRRSNT